MLSVKLTPAAKADVNDAYDWYESILPGLGAQFNEEVVAAISRIEANPRMTAPVFEDVRRVLLRKFPYVLFFHVETEAVYIIACFHGSRDPKIWQSRT